MKSSATKSGATIAFNQIHEPTGKRIKYEKVVPGVGPVDVDEIVKGFQYAKDQYVLLDDEEIDGTNLDVHQRISEMADPLHFGYFGGYWTKAIWFLFGSLMTALSVSGMAIYALHIGRKLKQATPFRVGWQRAWLGMGYWRWIATACVIAGFVMLPTLFWASAE